MFCAPKIVLVLYIAAAVLDTILTSHKVIPVTATAAKSELLACLVHSIKMISVDVGVAGASVRTHATG